ncbi:amino acid ABC transporter substrate-binding protein [Ureibacillus manganicus]|uniref:ABC transporter substrate-binding protein n=1 Tax=Ureibacillus manganicus DSM 26584 TaxID=1384049 RepID=A0A0A3I3D9_9BACL|nr:amino acid ABC transporter substrate-binding protein [Ureibacillus manganicus]KGR79291.1 ABC transporter substrate-binding protein [Ureibacillus manganicus DSM 26584]
MKKISFLLILTLVVGILAACGGNEEGTTNEGSNQTEEKKVIRAGATGVSYPNSYKENDKLIGFDVEVLEIAAANLGYEVQWVNSDFSGLLGQLETGKIDTIANAVAVTEERKGKYDFADPYSYLGITIVTHEENDQINSLEDLKGKTVSGVLGSNNVKNLEAYDKNGEIGIRTYETRDGAMNDAINKRVDGYVNSKPALLAEINKGNLPLKFVGDPFVYEAVAFPFVKGTNEELREALSAEVQKLHEDGTITELSIKYFGEDVSKKD